MSELLQATAAQGRDGLRAGSAAPRRPWFLRWSWSPLRSRGAPLLVPLALLILWQVAAARGWLAEQILPAPSLVLQSLAGLAASGELWEHARGSLLRVGTGFGIAAVLGVSLGALLGASRRAEAYVLPTFEVYAQTPVIAWIPIGILLFGISGKLAVFLICIAALVPVVMNTFKGARHIPPAYLELARVYGLSRWRLFSRVVAPAALPSIVLGLRMGLSQAWLTLVAAELVGIERGLGVLIVESRNLFQLDIVLGVIVLLGLAGFILDKSFVMLERRLASWRGPAG